MSGTLSAAFGWYKGEVADKTLLLDKKVKLIYFAKEPFLAANCSLRIFST